MTSSPHGCAGSHGCHGTPPAFPRRPEPAGGLGKKQPFSRPFWQGSAGAPTWLSRSFRMLVAAGWTPAAAQDVPGPGATLRDARTRDRCESSQPDPPAELRRRCVVLGCCGREAVVYVRVLVGGEPVLTAFCGPHGAEYRVDGLIPGLCVKKTAWLCGFWALHPRCAVLHFPDRSFECLTCALDLVLFRASTQVPVKPRLVLDGNLVLVAHVDASVRIHQSSSVSLPVSQDCRHSGFQSLLEPSHEILDLRHPKSPGGSLPLCRASTSDRGHRMSERAWSIGNWVPLAEQDGNGARQPDWIDYRASRARAARRLDAGETVAACAGCGTEVDVDEVVHSPRCKGDTDPVVAEASAPVETAPPAIDAAKLLEALATAAGELARLGATDPAIAVHFQNVCVAARRLLEDSA